MDVALWQRGFAPALLALFLAGLWFVPAAANAAAIGAVPPTEGLRFGALLAMSRADVDDPDGATETKSYSRLAIIGTRPAAKGRRWLGEVFYHRFDTEPDIDSIGMDVTRVGAALSYQARFAKSSSAPWFGAGLAVARDRFDERLTVDAFGFVDRRFPSRSDTAVALVLNATKVWNWTRTFDVGVHAQYEQPLTGDIKALSLGVLLMF